MTGDNDEGTLRRVFLFQMASIVPVYYQIKQTIKNWIINKEYDSGEKIPSENDLAYKFEVSRLTVRQAIAQLIEEGLLRSKRGEGTFVTGDQKLIDSYSLEFTGFMDDLFYEVSKTRTKSVEIGKIPVPKFVRDRGGLDKSIEEVEQIKRVRFKGEKSFAYTVNYLWGDLAGKITENALYTKPLLQILEEDLGVKFTEAFQTIEASFADRLIAEKLGVPSGSPILFVERIMYTKNRKPVEIVQSSYRSDLYKYIVRLRSLKRKNGSFWVHQSS